MAETAAISPAASGKAGVLVLHQPGQDRAEALVVLAWRDWRAPWLRTGGTR